MTWNEYQKWVLTKLSEDSKKDQLTNSALGLCGEAGEYADLVKKHKHHGHDLDRAKAIKELGDQLFYIAEGADALGATLEEVAMVNVAKLEARYPSGFTTENSKLKLDEKPEFPPNTYITEGELTPR